MKLRMRLILFLQVTLVRCDISGFLGDNVTLPSGADASWVLSSIEWSIFSNITRIATYSNNKENLNRVARYKGRLRLNSSTGDLTILGLTSGDALQYTVDFTNTAGRNKQTKATVTVMERLQKPTVEIFDFDKCHRLVECRSSVVGVVFSWEATHSSYTVTAADGLSAAFFRNSTRQPVNVTCVARRGPEEASRSVQLTCRGDELKPAATCVDRTRYFPVFLVSLVLGVVLTLGVYYFYRRYGETSYETNEGN